MFSHFESDPSPADTNPSTGTSWYLIHTKPRQELIALENLSRQDYECYMPTLAVEKLVKQSPEHLYESGDQVLITQGAFAGIEAVFKMKDGDKRVMVLIEMMSKPVSLPLQVSSIRRINRDR